MRIKTYLMFGRFGIRRARAVHSANFIFGFGHDCLLVGPWAKYLMEFLGVRFVLRRHQSRYGW